MRGFCIQPSPPLQVGPTSLHSLFPIRTLLPSNNFLGFYLHPNHAHQAWALGQKDIEENTLPSRPTKTSAIMTARIISRKKSSSPSLPPFHYTLVPSLTYLLWWQPCQWLDDSCQGHLSLLSHVRCARDIIGCASDVSGTCIP